MSHDEGYGYDDGERVGGTGQTRTRLPDAPGGDPYGGARRPARASRGLVTVVGVVVLLIAAIAFANQGGGGDGAGTGDAKSPTTGATAPTGTRPVAGRHNDVPAGFGHTEQGAESAAANYAVALGSDGMFDKERRRRIVNAVYLPDVAAARLTDLDRAYSEKGFLSGIGLDADGRAPKGMTFISRTNPVGTKLERYEGDAASVSVWYSTLFGIAGEGSKNPVTESWYTNTFELRWINGDWRVSTFAQKDGPVPVARDQAASTAQEMTDAVSEFGGFTYAR
ncbi:hypothetical protein [Streptomyces sp. NPDC101132]|uniref:hypothetical protein n=1 Tax=Streptomyces sp. NPDC101132 TaxID=3366110 RepID=UPI0037FE1FFD